MDVTILLLIGLLLFAFATFIRRWHDYAMLFTIAIGFAVNANIYNSITTPVMFGNFRLSIDAFLYTGFIFTVLVCANEYGTRKAKILTSSTIAAVLLSAAIEFLSKVSSFEYTNQFLINLFGYVASTTGTFIGIWISLFIFEKLKVKVSVYLLFIIFVLIISVFNLGIYHSYYLITSKASDGFIYIILGGLIGRIVAVLYGLIGYFINTHYWIPLDLMDKYGVKTEEHISDKEA